MSVLREAEEGKRKKKEVGVSLGYIPRFLKTTAPKLAGRNSPVGQNTHQPPQKLFL